MTKTEFFKEFVTEGLIKRPNWAYHGTRTRYPHAVLTNGWTIPTGLLTKLRRVVPKDAEVIIRQPLVFDFEEPLEFRYTNGSIIFHEEFLTGLD